MLGRRKRKNKPAGWNPFMKRVNAWDNNRIAKEISFDRVARGALRGAQKQAYEELREEEQEFVRTKRVIELIRRISADISRLEGDLVILRQLEAYKTPTVWDAAAPSKEAEKLRKKLYFRANESRALTDRITAELRYLATVANKLGEEDKKEISKARNLKEFLKSAQKSIYAIRKELNYTRGAQVSGFKLNELNI